MTFAVAQIIIIGPVINLDQKSWYRWSEHDLFDQLSMSGSTGVKPG